MCRIKVLKKSKRKNNPLRNIHWLEDSIKMWISPYSKYTLKISTSFFVETLILKFLCKDKKLKLPKHCCKRRRKLEEQDNSVPRLYYNNQGCVVEANTHHQNITIIAAGKILWWMLKLLNEALRKNWIFL